MMTVRRRLVGSVAVIAVGLLFGGLAAGPALAHGAPGSPVSRAAACGPDARQTNRSAACTAAVAAGNAAEQWDNIRVPDVAGQDRKRIPDGRLCSAGIARFRGLDLPRADWPATRLRVGVELSFTYRTTIPHKGTFRWYVTSQGYDPSQPLTWSDLGEKPFLTATDPPVVDGSYRMRGKLPAGLSGRHLVYAIWQNSSTPDTYYSCSDVVLDGGPAAGAASTTRPSGARPGSVASASASPGGGRSEDATGIGPSDPSPNPAAASVNSDGGGGIGLVLGALVLVAVLGVPTGLWLRRRRGMGRPAARIS